MDMLERELVRTLRSVHTDEQLPTDIHTAIRRRRHRRALRNGGATVTAIVAVVALVTGGFVLGDRVSGEPSTHGGNDETSEMVLPTKMGRITVEKKLDGGVVADSILGFVDESHVVVSPYGYDVDMPVRYQVVDVRTGEARVFLSQKDGAGLAYKRRTYLGSVTGTIDVWADADTIHAIDVNTQKRWDVSPIVPRPLSDLRGQNGLRPTQFAVGSGYVVWRNYTKRDQEVYVAPVKGGDPRKLTGVGASAALSIEHGRLSAYDGHTVRIFDLASGKLLAQRVFERVATTDNQLHATCGVEYCVRGKKAPGATPDREDTYAGAPFTYSAVLPEVMRISDGELLTVPRSPVVTDPVVDVNNLPEVPEEISRPRIVGHWLMFDTGSNSPHVTGYAFDMRSSELYRLGRGQHVMTSDGHLVSIPSLKPGPVGRSATANVEIKYTKLP